MVRQFILLLAALVLVPCAGANDFVVEYDVMIPMRDGTRLAADIYFPVEGGDRVEAPRPLLLTRTPYGKDRERTVGSAAHFAANGYVAVIQDMRGRYRYEG